MDSGEAPDCGPPKGACSSARGELVLDAELRSDSDSLVSTHTDMLMDTVLVGSPIRLGVVLARSGRIYDGFGNPIAMANSSWKSAIADSST